MYLICNNTLPWGGMRHSTIVILLCEMLSKYRFVFSRRNGVFSKAYHGTNRRPKR
uniref:Uncharacterized protein n=1 Tax=Triticum urartu TaxID=4572 RepID=A0A8R7TWC7_TRIUA